MFTRAQYMNRECSHQEYYGQFVTLNVLRLVENHIGRDRILTSSDPHFNDIPLYQWDKLCSPILSMVGHRIRAVNNQSFVWLADAVCIAKAAAEMIRGRTKKGETCHYE